MLPETLAGGGKEICLESEFCVWHVRYTDRFRRNVAK